MSDKKTEIKKSKTGIYGDDAKVEGGIHFYAANFGFVSVLALALVAIFSLVTVLFFINAYPETRPKSFPEATLAVILATAVSIAMVWTLAKVCKNIHPVILLFLILPLCSLMASLNAAACITNTPFIELVEKLIFSCEEQPDRNVQPSEIPAVEPVAPVPANTGQSDGTETKDSFAGSDITIRSDASPAQKSSSTESENTDSVALLVQPNVIDNPVTEIWETKESFSNNLGMTFVYIPPGEFLMGSPENELGPGSDETRHRVKLTQEFYMQTTEVTQGQWKAVTGENPSLFKGCGDDCPVESVSWNNVQKFIEELNRMDRERTGTYRLPTEAQWEYACRAGTVTRYYTGDSEADLDRAGWYEGNSGRKTHPVGKKEPNAWGLYDMHGNVWEWCQDRSGAYPSNAVTDPAGPDTGAGRVFRGGSWSFTELHCLSAFRSRRIPDDRDGYLGFRLVLFPGQQ